MLLSYSTSWCQTNLLPSTGELNDSVLISIYDLRVATSKMLELKYEKKINKELKELVANDSIILHNTIVSYNDKLSKEENKTKRYKTEKNYFLVTTIIEAVLLLISIL